MEKKMLMHKQLFRMIRRKGSSSILERRGYRIKGRIGYYNNMTCF